MQKIIVKPKKVMNSAVLSETKPLKAVEAVQNFKRIKLFEYETIKDLIAEGRR